MKRRWISSPRASSANCALTTAPWTASVISMKRTGRWKATTGTPARAQPATTGARHVAPARAQLDRQRGHALLDQRRRPRRLVGRLGARAEPGRQHQFAALEQVVRVAASRSRAPSGSRARARRRPTTTSGSARRTTGRSSTSARLSMTLRHASWRNIRPTVHCEVTSATGRVGNGQTEGVRVAATQAEADIHLEGVSKRFADMTAVDDLTLSIPRGSFFAMLGPSGCGKTTTLRMIGGFEDPTAGRVFLGGVGRHQPPALQARRQHRLPVLRALPAPDRREERRVRPRAQEGRQGRGHQARARGARARAARPPRQAQARAALRRPAAARRAGPRARQPAARAAARRAARRARPAAAQAAPDRAQAHPAGRRDHVRARDARSGGGHEHGRHDRGHERRQDRAGGLAPPTSTSARGPRSWPTSSASRT